jgi:hypothetical protein
MTILHFIDGEIKVPSSQSYHINFHDVSIKKLEIIQYEEPPEVISSEYEKKEDYTQHGSKLSFKEEKEEQALSEKEIKFEQFSNRIFYYDANFPRLRTLSFDLYMSKNENLATYEQLVETCLAVLQYYVENFVEEYDEKTRKFFLRDTNITSHRIMKYLNVDFLMSEVAERHFQYEVEQGIFSPIMKEVKDYLAIIATEVFHEILGLFDIKVP